MQMQNQMAQMQLKFQIQQLQSQDKMADRQSREKVEALKIMLERLRIQEEQIIHDGQAKEDATREAMKLLMDHHLSSQQAHNDMQLGHMKLGGMVMDAQHVDTAHVGEGPERVEVGRELADVSFPADRYVSARHARIDVRDGSIVLADVGSSNGTFVRISAPTRVAAGDQILIGMQLVRVE
jgi:hypothetical protein